MFQTVVKKADRLYRTKLCNNYEYLSYLNLDQAFEKNTQQICIQ